VSQQPARITDNLTSVIQVIQKGRESGELRAKLDDEASKEVGTIVFANGQIVAAQVGPYQGVEAFNILKSWSRCVFVFVRDAPTARLPQSGPLPQSSGQTPFERRMPTTGPQQSVNGSRTPLPEPPSDSTLSLTFVPRATMSVVKAIGIIERAGLSRTYRQLILLVDGRRSIGELAITMSCPHQEMRQMLQELERLTIIRIVS
jgi:hypothetical protein